MGWVLVWWRYMTQHLLSVQKHLSLTLQWWQSNRMTMIGQNAINFGDISLSFCGWTNWQVIFAHGLIRHSTLPAEPYHACFYYASWQWSVNLETLIWRIIENNYWLRWRAGSMFLGSPLLEICCVHLSMVVSYFKSSLVNEMCTEEEIHQFPLHAACFPSSHE